MNFGQLLVITKQVTVAREHLESEQHCQRELGGPWPGSSQINHFNMTPVSGWFRNSQSHGLDFAASLAGLLCCLCLHSRVGEKEQPRRKKQTEERFQVLLTL